MTEIVIFLFAVLMAFAVAFATGSNDEMMAPGVAARVFSLQNAVILGAIFSVAGAFLLGREVAKTIGKDLINTPSSPERALTDSMIIAVLIAMIIVLISLSIKEGLPLSTTQAVVGAVIGVVLTAGISDPVNWGLFAVNYSELLVIIAGWVISPIIGFFAAATVHFWLQRIEEPVLNFLNETGGGISGRERLNRFYTYSLGIFLILSTASRAGNDVANSIAPVLSLQSLQGQDLSYIMLIGGLGMAIGLVVVGRKVIRVVAREIVMMNPASALSAMVSVTIVMTLGTLIGFPLSGTHILVFAMIAVGWAERSPIQRQMVKTIVISWIVTLPVAAVLGGIIWLGADWIFITVGV